MDPFEQDEPNPYAAPRAGTAATAEFNAAIPVVPVGHGLRFLNYLIDYIVQFVISFVLGIAVVVIWGAQGADFIERTPGILIGIPILLGYYFLFEVTTSRTIGKLVTGTKVVNADGQRPSIGQYLGRSFSRLIPFEPLSFLGGSARGWHDSLSNTYVVKSRTWL